MFGSILDGNVETSPVDLVVIGEVDVFDLGEATGRLELALGHEINLKIYRPDEWDALSYHPFIINLLSRRGIIRIKPKDST